MDQAAYESLTDRQRECLRLVGREHGSKEIARLLGKSPETVNAHIKAALVRLEGGSRFAAARELRDFESAHPWLVNQPRGMAGSGTCGDLDPVDYRGRPAPSPTLHDGHYGLVGFAPDRTFPEVDGHGGSVSEDRLRRLTLAAALTLLVALAIISAVPMSDAFEKFADLLRPYLKG